MEGIGAAFGHHVNDGAGVAAIFGSEVVGDDAKFLGGIRSRAKHAAQTARNRGVVVINAIQKEVVIAFAGTIHRYAAQTAVRNRGSWRKQNQFIGVARDQRQVLDGPFVHQIADLRGFEIDVGNLIGAHLDFFGDRARLQLHVHGEHLGDGD